MKDTKIQQAQAFTTSAQSGAGSINVLDFEVDFEHVTALKPS